MKYPYVISSDQHCHDWSAFSTIDPDGVNSRLRVILNENERAATMLKEAGGDTMFLAGDLFHVRGSIKPSVFNPTEASFKAICKDVTVEAIPGNHDLEGKDADALGNAMQTLGNIPGFNVHHEPTLVGQVLVVPWFQDLQHLRRILKGQHEKLTTDGYLPSSIDLIIHAPVNGVIKGIPDHGLEAGELAKLGFRRVFAGHYHNHVVFEDGKVISVGATTHQTWNDPGTKAGFLLVWPDKVIHVPSNAPKFVDFDFEALDDHGVELMRQCQGNYVRAKLTDVSEKDVKGWRKDLEGAGALGVNLIITKTGSVTRTGASIKAGSSLEASVTHFITNDMKPTLLAEVQAEALSVLAEASS